MKIIKNKCNAIIIGSTAIKYWYKDFYRNPPDIDIYAISGFDKEFLLVNKPKKIIIHNKRKFTAIMGGVIVDTIMHTRGSHIFDMIKYERNGGFIVSKFGINMVMTSPKILLLIKDLLSRYDEGKKVETHKKDYEFLLNKLKIESRYSTDELLILQKGINHLNKFYQLGE